MSTRTVEELRALGVALLHLLTLICSRLHVAVCGGEHGRPGLHEELAHLHVVTGGGAVQGSPGAQVQALLWYIIVVILSCATHKFSKCDAFMTASSW